MGETGSNVTRAAAGADVHFFAALGARYRARGGVVFLRIVTREYRHVAV